MNGLPQLNRMEDSTRHKWAIAWHPLNCSVTTIVRTLTNSVYPDLMLDIQCLLSQCCTLNGQNSIGLKKWQKRNQNEARHPESWKKKKKLPKLGIGLHRLRFISVCTFNSLQVLCVPVLKNDLKAFRLMGLKLTSQVYLTLKNTRFRDIFILNIKRNKKKETVIQVIVLIDMTVEIFIKYIKTTQN